MSEENVEIVRRIYADPGGLAAGAGGRVAPDAEFDFSAVFPDRPILKGVEALRRFRDTGPFGGSAIRFQPEKFLDLDSERVLVFVRVLARGGGSGAPVEIQAAHEVTIRNQRLVRFKAYANREDALEAVGLSE
jgi:ketosteroid isomerase-like protein